MCRCDNCGARFEEQDYVRVCWEDYFGVSSMFSNYNYGTIAECPNCGSEDIDEYDDEEEEW